MRNRDQSECCTRGERAPVRHSGSAKNRSLALRLIFLAGLIVVAFCPPASCQILESSSLLSERAGHTATLLTDGRVLIVGGANQGGPLSSLELFDPATARSWPGGSLNAARSDHAAVLLADGRVLIAGGLGHSGALSSSELYDPRTGTIAAGPSLHVARVGHTATALTDGTVLIAGGDLDGSAEILDAGATRSTLLSARMAAPHAHHSAILLPNGAVFIAGGIAPFESVILALAEVFDPAALSFSAAGALQVPRTRSVLRALPDRKIQIVGGAASGEIEVYDPQTGAFTVRVPALPEPLSASDLLGARTRSALIYPQPPGRTPVGVHAAIDRVRHSLTELPGNKALIAGGQDGMGRALSSAILVQSTPATVTTDLVDYHPGQRVTVTGIGWMPGESVRLTFHREPDNHGEVAVMVKADNSGTFVDGNFAPAANDVGRAFTLTAQGQSSGYIAQTGLNDSGPIAFVKTIGTNSRNTTGNGSIAVTVPASGVIAGNSIIVSLVVGSVAGGIACSDTKGNTYHTDLTSGAGAPRIAVVSAHNVTALGSGDTITCTYPGFAGGSLVSANEFSGLAPAPLDQSAQAASTNSGAASSGLTPLTTQPNELIFGLVELGTTNEVFTPATSGSDPPETYALPPNSSPYTTVGVNFTMNPMFRIVSTAAQYEANGTVAGSGGWRAAVVTYKGAGPQLRITKQATPPSFVVGAAASYTLTVVNEGGQPTSASATVTDNIPAGLVLGTVPASCASSGLQVTCTIPAGAAAGSQVAFTIPVTPTASGSVVNTATVSGGGDATCSATPAPTRCASTVTTAVSAPQLRIIKDATPASFTVGAAGSYALTVLNEGTVATTGPTTVSDNIPAGVVLGALPPGCGASGQQVTCAIPAGLAAGTSASFAIPVTPTTPATPLANTATVSGGGDPTCSATPPPTRCASTVVTTVNTPQLRVTKQASPASFTVGVDANYTLTVANEGTAATTADATVTDNIPGTLVLGSLPSGCGASGQQVTCAIPAGLAAGASASFAIPVTPTASATALTNTATVSGGGDPTCSAESPATRCSSTVTTAVDAPQLRVSKQASSASFTVGAAASYSLTVGNQGTAATTATATVTDNVPASLTLGPMPAGCAASGQQVTCTIPAGLTAGSEVSFVIPITPTASGSVVNTATVSGGGDATCATGLPTRCASTITTAVDAPQLRITKDASAASFTVGAAASYTLTVVNEGTAATTAPAMVVDSIPAGLTLGPMPVGCEASGQQVTCTTPAGLAAGSQVSFVIPVTPTASGSVVNTATASGGGDPTCPTGAPTRCVSSVTTAVDAPQLRITKEASAASFIVGAAASYTLTVVNEGTAATTATATVADNVPAGLTLGPMPVGCEASGQQVTCAIPAGLGAGAVVSFVIPVTPIASGSVVNTATVSGGGDPTCPTGDPTRCESTITTAVDAPQLRVSKDSSAASFTVGAAANYTLTVVNEGTATTTATATVADNVPAGLTLGPMPAGCEATGQEVTCTIPAGLAAGAATSFVIPVTPTASGSVVNTATVSGGGDPTCPTADPTRCTSTVTTAVDTPQLRVSKQASTASFTVGAAGSYTLTVLNEGTAATTAIATVADNVPAGLTLGLLPAGCAASGQQVTCTIPAGLAAGAAVSFVILVTPTVSGSVVDTATVTGGGDPTCPAGDPTRCESAVTMAVSTPQLRIEKQASTASFTVGAAASYTLTVLNEGTAATTAPATAIDNVPAGLTLGPLPVGCEANSQQVTCTIPAGLAAGAAVSLVIPITPTVSGSVVNTATVSGGGDATCPTGATRCESTVTTAVSAPQLRITKVATPERFTEGVMASYTLTVLNEGTAPTTAPATVADNIPTGLTLGALPAGCETSGQLVTCTIPGGLGASAAVSFAISVTPTAAAIPAVNNTATASGGGDPGCPAAERCTSAITTAVAGLPVVSPVLRVSKEATTTSLTVGVPFDYVLTVTNAGTGPTTTTATVGDNVPAALALTSVPAGCTAVLQSVSCTIAPGLAAGGQVAFTIAVTPTGSAGSVSNTATISGGGDPTCPAAPRCSSTVVMSGAEGTVQLRLTKTADASTIAAGTPLTFNLTVVNEGSQPTTAPAIVVDTLPSTVRLTSVPSGCTAAGVTVTCTVTAGLTPGASVTFPLTVVLNSGATGSVRNIAAASGGGDPGCPAEARCNAVVQVPIVEATAVPVSSPMMLVLIAAAVLALALHRLRAHA